MMPARPYNDKYAQIALGLSGKVSKKVDRLKIAPVLWNLADYLESVDSVGKHDQHLIQMGVKWIKDL